MTSTGLSGNCRTLPRKIVDAHSCAKLYKARLSFSVVTLSLDILFIRTSAALWEIRFRRCNRERILNDSKWIPQTVLNSNCFLLAYNGICYSVSWGITMLNLFNLWILKGASRSKNIALHYLNGGSSSSEVDYSGITNALFWEIWYKFAMN